MVVAVMLAVVGGLAFLMGLSVFSALLLARKTDQMTLRFPED